MRFDHKLFQKFRFINLFLFCFLITGTVWAQNKPGKEVVTSSVSLKVADDNGNPIPKAKVVIGEGLIHAETDENGVCSFVGYPDGFVTISASGYEKNVSLVQDIIKENTIILKKSKLFVTSDDDVPLPFLTMKKRYITGSTNVIRRNQLEKYPSTDLRNAFTGLIPGLEVVEFNGSSGLTAEEKMGTYRITERTGIYGRGRSMMFIIDDIPTDITEMPLDPQEIESVTIIKDIAGKAMFGPMGADGIIFIKTRRGRTNERILEVNIEDGVSVIDRFPGWTSGADYATLNNLARKNSGLASIYDDNAITAYAKNDPYDMYHPSVNYRDVMLRNTKSFRRINVSSSGGNDVVNYSAYMGYNGEGDIYKLGPVSDYNRISTRSNIDVKINDLIKVQFDFYGGLSYRRSSNYGYATSESSGLTDLNEFSSAITDITNTPPIAFPVYANNDPALQDPWYGVSSSTYTMNPIGNIMGNGYYTESGRTASLTTSIDYDISDFIEGLKSRTYLSFNALNVLRIGKAENYIAYIARPSKSAKTGNDTILLTKAHDGVSTPNLSNLHDYYTKRFAVYENLSFERSFGIHNIKSSLTYFLTFFSRNGIGEPLRKQTGVWTGNYSYNDKYIVQGVLNYAGTSNFAKGERAALFPSAGAAWVISEENFMSGLKLVNYLKLHAEAGILGYDFSTPFYFRDNWSNNTTGAAFGPYSTNQWFGSTTDVTVYRTTPSRTGNPALTFEKRKEFSIGIDGMMLNNKLTFDISYFNTLREGQFVTLSNSMPYIAGISSTLPYFNYNNTRYFGLEYGIQFTGNTGQFLYSVGANATTQNSKIEKADQSAYRYDYQSSVGRPTDSYWGQTYLGKFGSDEEALVVPQLYDAVLYAGDLKYKDMNGDKVVDDNDMSVIGHYNPRLVYAINANLKHRNFEVTIIGSGRAFLDISLTNKYFWNGWGDNNYSNFVKDNIGGAYPKLTYYKVNNNFVASDFWLTKGGYFKIQNVELAYTIPANNLQIIRSQGIRLFIRGTNLLTFTKVKDVDPESINSGVTLYPLYKTFTGGIKLTF